MVLGDIYFSLRTSYDIASFQVHLLAFGVIHGTTWVKNFWSKTLILVNVFERIFAIQNFISSKPTLEDYWWKSF